MVRRTLALTVAVLLTAGTASAQQTAPPAAPAPQEKPAPKPAAPEGQPSNIRVELAITDQTGANPASKRTVSMIVADRNTGSVRSQGDPRVNSRTATLNVDASPVIVKDGLMRLQLGLEYLPRAGEGSDGQGSLNQRMTVLVESGKPIVVSQASDPTSDRKMTVELTATILK